MTDEDERKATKGIESLHQRFTGFEGRLDQLHDDHTQLRIEVNNIRSDLALDVADLDKHKLRTSMRIDQILESIGLTREGFVEFRAETNNRWNWVLVFAVTTMTGAIGSLLILVIKGLSGGLL